MSGATRRVAGRARATFTDPTALSAVRHVDGVQSPEDDAGITDVAGAIDSGQGWRDRGLCAQTDPEAFFPDKGGSTREAKKVCRGCEVRAECLEFALENDERFGVWGGLSERELRALRRERQGRPAA